VSGPLLRVEGLTAGWREPVVGPLSFTVEPGGGGWPVGPQRLRQVDPAPIAQGARVFGGAIRRAPGLSLAYQEQQPVRLPLMPLTGRDLLRAAGADAASVPGPLAPLLAQRIDRLSGGQYQLLSVWCALGSPADLVLLDEPTNNLDPETESLLTLILRSQRGRRSVLMVSHEREFLAAACSRVFDVGGVPALPVGSGQGIKRMGAP
jgi:ABC-type iron transport system FetAB ATPase subunit